MGNQTLNRFRVGEIYCGITMLPTIGCPHCRGLELEPGVAMRVSAVDQERGVVSFETVDDDSDD